MWLFWVQLQIRPTRTESKLKQISPSRQRRSMQGTFILLSQLVSHVPVLVASQNIVGDVDVAGSHVVDALRDGDGPCWGGASGACAASGRADRGWTQGHRWWCFCAPARQKGRVSPLCAHCQLQCTWKTNCAPQWGKNVQQYLLVLWERRAYKLGLIEAKKEFISPYKWTCYLKKNHTRGYPKNRAIFQRKKYLIAAMIFLPVARSCYGS